MGDKVEIIKQIFLQLLSDRLLQCGETVSSGRDWESLELLGQTPGERGAWLLTHLPVLADDIQAMP